MKPVCDHHNYRDKHCYDSGQRLHYSVPGHDGRLGIPRSKAKGIFWYTGRHGRGSLLNTGRGHRWRKNTDKNQFTMCVEPGKKFLQRVRKAGNKKFWRVRVVGNMDANHIRKACKRVGMKPVCDHRSYNDGHCFHATQSLHYSHPHHDGRLGFSRSKAKGIYWYTGRHGTGSLLNTGSTHRWQKRGHALLPTSLRMITGWWPMWSRRASRATAKTE